MASFQDMSFFEMSTRFGEVAALGLLEQIEKVSGIAPRHASYVDPEIRLQNAILLQDAGESSSFRIAA